MWHTTPAPSPSAEGYRLVWVRSSTKFDRDADSRHARIAKGIAALDDLNQRLASPKTRIKTVVADEAAASAALDHVGATRWIRFDVEEATEDSYRQERRGRPGADTRYRRLTRTHHPSAPRILDVLRGIQRHHLIQHGNVVQVFEPELTPLHRQVLDLLHVVERLGCW